MTGIRDNMFSKITAAALIALMIVAAFPYVSGGTVHAASLYGTGTINSPNVIMRKSWSESSKKVRTLKQDTAVTIKREVFTTKKGTSSSKRWYAVSYGGKTGFVRSDLVDITSWAGAAAFTTDGVNYRSGPDTSFKVLGSTGKGINITVLLKAKRPGGKVWYKVDTGGRTGYMSSDYVKLGTAESFIETGIIAGFKKQFAKLLSTLSPTPAQKLNMRATNGGKARTIYTFNSRNCKKLFPVTGFGNTQVPQAFTFTGKVYYVLYGMENSQCIITYSSKGKRLKVSPFPSNYGHLNGITWDPLTGLCYIFKGRQTTIYTWNPATDEFGTATTQYSSSGVGYDPLTQRLYASSESCIRVYSADGNFDYLGRIERCTPKTSVHVQDCGASNGYVFHGVTDRSNRFLNYLDVYRISDGKYLGSIKVKMDEYESVVVGNDGYVQLMINTAERVDYVWKTPLNVFDLQ